MRFALAAVFIVSLISISSCAQDYSLAPPADSELVTVTVKVPKELEAETMNVMYRSPVCKRVTYGASGKRHELDGYQNIDRQPQRQGQSDLYQVKLPVNGGGACQWHLNNVTFGVKYSYPTRYGEEVRYGAGGGVVVVFDENNSPRGGTGIAVEGDLTIKKDYYPWLSESFLGGYRKRISLVGEGDIYLGYQALQARHIYFEPVLHTEYLATSEGTKVHKVGSFIKFTYPDGSSAADGRSKPDFRKLQAIRLAAESQK